MERPSVLAALVLHFAAMTRATLERRLTEIGVLLRDLRHELAVADEQLAHFADEADDARLRSLVSETPLAEREHRTAARHAEAMERHRNEVVADIGRLEEQQDELLDRLNDAIG
jgi:chromosome segregation ATPase